MEFRYASFRKRYKVFRNGEVYDEKNNKYLNQYLRGRYKVVSLFGENESVHRLVAKLFVPNPELKPNVNHIDGDRLNNNSDNLEWCTQSENIQHAWDNGLAKGSEKQKAISRELAKKMNEKRKIPVVDISNGKEYESIKEAAIDLGMPVVSLHNNLYKNKKNKTNIRFK